VSMHRSDLAYIGEVLRVAAVDRAQGRSRARRRSALLALFASISLLAVAGGALASGSDLGFLPGYSSASTPVVAADAVTTALAPASSGPTDSVLGPSGKQLEGLSSFGVDLAQLHRASSARLGVSVVIAPSTRQGGGVCVLYIQKGTTVSQCGTEADVESGGRISAPDGSPIYVGLRPDGVTSVVATDGTRVPIVDNVYISDKPIASSPHG
jgi:hypothetical protein